MFAISIGSATVDNKSNTREITCYIHCIMMLFSSPFIRICKVYVDSEDYIFYEGVLLKSHENIEGFVIIYPLNNFSML